MIKDPQATLDYALDWTHWLQDGETITTAEWNIPDGLTQPEGKPPTVDGGMTVVWLTGGTAKTTYWPTVRITTSAGRVDERSIEIAVKDR